MTGLAAAGRLVRPLSWIALATIVAACGAFAAFVLIKPPGLAGLFPAGFGGIAAGSLVLSALGSLACLCLAWGRRRDAARRAAGSPQTAIVILFSVLAAAAVLADWPGQLAAGSGFAGASAMLLLATPWLLIARGTATVTAEQLPEIDDLRALLFLPVFFLAAEAVLQVIGGLGLGGFGWIQIVLGTLVLLISLELSLRAMMRWFLPPPDEAAARAAVTSLLARALSGRALPGSGVAGVVRSQFGMDFSRSWALRFVRGAAVPVLLMMLTFCWFLTGVTRIDLNERGSYERFGAAAAMLRPGLHLLLPWPFGIVRRQELGVVHAALITDADMGAATPDHSTAEGPAPASANRLWDSEQPSDVSYLIASGDQGRQSFQTVSASVRVLYRVGLSDTAARDALYNEADPAALVHALAGRRLASYFAAQTLPAVLGENQGVIASALKQRLQTALDAVNAGIDVMAVTIEAIHPPSGAAPAYRNVQAAEIGATTAIASERGRALTTKSVAEMNAHNATNDATAAAGETASAARVDFTDMAADDVPYRASGPVFLMERYFADVQAALAGAPLEIVDHRLGGETEPTIDLRPPGMFGGGSTAGSKP